MTVLQQLGLGDDASESDVKGAWREMAGRLHPDRGGDPAEFDRMRKVYHAALDLVTRPVLCPECHGNGRKPIVHGWVRTTIVCPNCKGSKLVERRQ